MDKQEDEIIDLEESDEIIEQPIGEDIVSHPNLNATYPKKNDNKITKRENPADNNSSNDKKFAGNSNLKNNNQQFNQSKSNQKNDLGNNKSILPKNSFMNKSNPVDDNRLKQALEKRHDLPKVPGINNQNSKAESKEKTSVGDEVKKKAASTALTAATGGALSGPVADMAADAILNKVNQSKKKIKYIIIASLVPIFLIIVIILSFIGVYGTNEDLGKDTAGYVTGNMSEDDLLAQLQYYGYCHDISSCKKQGAYKFFEKLKSVYELSKLSCGATTENNKPCGITLNTALIIETINYYENATDNFDTYDETEENLNFFQSLVSKFKKAMKDKTELDTMLSDVDALAIAQAEYVKETCKVNGKKQTNYYYQISFNKYISYLKYGTSSSHPNYQGKPVEIENDTCQGPTNDYIETQYETSTDSSLATDPNTGKPSVAGNGKGVEIANYALQFVGNPYVWGGTDLIKGVDCSGFTMKVMEHFGYSIPHSSAAQINYGTYIGTNVANAAAGDLIIYDGHVSIYLGNNSIVHASNPKDGIKVSNNASYRKIVGIVRLWG